MVTAEQTLRELVKDDSISEKDLAYMAGFFDGEGCITMSRASKTYGLEKRPRWYIRVIVTNTNNKVLNMLLEVFGGHISISKSLNPSHKDVYVWNINGSNAANFLLTIQPSLMIKDELAELALEFQRSNHNGNGKGTSWDYSPEESVYREFLYSEIRRLNGNHGSKSS